MAFLATRINCFRTFARRHCTIWQHSNFSSLVRPWNSTVLFTGEYPFTIDCIMIEPKVLNDFKFLLSSLSVHKKHLCTEDHTERPHVSSYERILYDMEESAGRLDEVLTPIIRWSIEFVSNE